MPIKIENVDYIENEDIQKIIDFYNKNKPLNNESLEILDRCEGGFKIMITYKNNLPRSANEKYKQLRWKNKYLRPMSYCKGFDYSEEKLLYYSMRTVFGNNVIYED